MNRFQAVRAKILGLFSKTVISQGPDDRKAKIDQLETREPGKEALERKQRSIARLRMEGVPVMDLLPVIDDSSQAKQRTTKEIAQRAIAIIIAAAKGEGVDQATINATTRKYGAQQFFSQEEAAFIREESPCHPDRIKFSWRYECGWVLLWSLGYVETLAKPETICDVPALAEIFISRNAGRLIKDAKLRPINQILDQADLIYRYNWAVTSARIKGLPAPAGLEGGVVQERHYALNWLIGYMDQEWDDISTDT